MGSRPLRLLYVVSLGLVLVVAFSAYQGYSRQFPYYFLWDQDHILNLDTLLIQSGMLPDHLAHPGFGVNLIAAWTQPAGHEWGLFSALNLQDLERSLQPIACMAERGDFLKAHSPVLAFGIAVALWSAICLLFRPIWELKILALAALLAEEAMVYQSCMARTELYAVFFWSIGLLALAIAMHARRSVLRAAILLTGGVFLGLANQTKLQALLYVAAAPFVCWLKNLKNDGDVSAEEPVLRLPGPWATSLACFNLLAFFILLLLAKRVVIPPGVATFTQSFQIIPLTLLVLAGLAALVGFFLLRKGEGLDRELATLITLLGTGGILSLGFHFAVFRDPSLSWQYLLQDFKMLFLSQKFYQMKSPGEYLQKLVDLITYDPVPYALNLAALGMLAASWAMGAITLTRRQLLALAALVVLSFANLVLGVRAIQRDALWTATLINFLTLAILSLLISPARRSRFGMRLAAVSVAFLLAASNVQQSSSILAKLDALYVSYGWRDDFFFQGIYGHNQPKYAALLQARYQGTKPDSMTRIRDLACRHDAAKRLTQYVFADRAVPLTHVGIADVDQPVWRNLLGIRIQRIPDPLRGGLVIDPMGLPPIGRHFTMPRNIFKEDEELVRPGPRSGEDSMRIRPRADLLIFLFQPVTDVTNPPPELPMITLSAGGPAIEYVGSPVTSETEIPLDPKRPIFVLVRHAFDDF